MPLMRLHCLELDLQNICNAKCPLCHFRTHYSEALATKLSLTRAFLEDRLGPFIFERVHLSGDLGEPTLSAHILDIIDFFVERDPQVFICINTHGCTRNHAFWQELARRLPERHEVDFAIDGLEDTYETYRVGLDFHRTLENALSFIEAGGFAAWTFIKFAHNEHQIDEARRRAEALGFTLFRTRDSYAEGGDMKRAGDYAENHAEVKRLGHIGSVRVEPRLFPYIQADGTLYSCTQSNCGRFDSGIDFDFSRLDLKTHDFARCVSALPDYCGAMQAAYPLTCQRRCGVWEEGQEPVGAEVGYGRRMIPD